MPCGSTWRRTERNSSSRGYICWKAAPGASLRQIEPTAGADDLLVEGVAELVQAVLDGRSTVSVQPGIGNDSGAGLLIRTA